MKTILINGVEVTAPCNFRIHLIGHPNELLRDFSFLDWSSGFNTYRRMEIGRAS